MGPGHSHALQWWVGQQNTSSWPARQLPLASHHPPKATELQSPGLDFPPRTLRPPPYFKERQTSPLLPSACTALLPNPGNKLVSEDIIHLLPHVALQRSEDPLQRPQTSEKGWINTAFQSWKLKHGESKAFTSSVLKVWSREHPLQAPKILPGSHEVKTIFIITLRCYLTFMPSSFRKCRVEFSRGYVMYGYHYSPTGRSRCEAAARFSQARQQRDLQNCEQCQSSPQTFFVWNTSLCLLKRWGSW